MTGWADDRTPASDDLMTQTIYDELLSHDQCRCTYVEIAEAMAHAVREALAKRRAETLRGPRTIKTDYHFSGFGL